MAAKKSQAKKRGTSLENPSQLSERLVVLFTVLSLVYLVVAFWRYG